MRIIGTVVGDGLQVLRELDRGVSSRVYLASDGAVVKALKLFKKDHLARAERELAIGSQLDHPHLNPVDSAVTVDGAPGVVMPFVPGARLTSWVRSGQPLPLVLRALSGVADALAYLHDLGIVHRDVKPENVLVDKNGHSRLLDFDLCARIGADEPPVVAGTIAYLSPEQARAQTPAPSGDLYGFGVMLYQSLTGQVPFTGTVAEVLQAHATETPLRASAIRPDLAAFDALLASLLAKDPRQRPADAASVAATLRAEAEAAASQV
ncbi:MAG TPA: serine/threonine-protein kinase [Trueperaceae bacterium]|nr:serine/threonine-protein kinase [Trueperaceae bacterium]